MPPGTRSLVAAPERRTRLQLDKAVGSSGAHIQRHQIEPAGAIRRAGVSVTPPIQTATDCLLQTGFADGMPIADSAISKLGLAPEQLMEAVEQRATARNGRAIRTALTTLRYADARAESGGESVARAVMIETGFAPDSASIRADGPLRFGQAHTNGLCLGAPGAGTHAGRARRGSSNIPTRPCWPDAPPPRRSLPNDSVRRIYRFMVIPCCALP